MIAIVVSCVLFIFGLICTVPPRKIKLFLPFWLHFNPKTHPLPPDHHVKLNPPAAPLSKTTTTASKVELRDVFATFDRNNDGFITRQELKESLKNIGISAGEKDVADMVARVDANGDGLIDLDEFCHLFGWISSSKESSSNLGAPAEDDDQGEGLREAFEVFDGNKDGLITVEELGLVLSSLGFNEGKKMDDCKEMIRKVDMDGDGMVNFEEFKKMMRDGLKGIINPLPSN